MIEPKAIFLDFNNTLSSSRFWEGTPFYETCQELMFGPLKSQLQPWMRGQLVAEDFVTQFAALSGHRHSDLLKSLMFSARQMQFDHPMIPDLVQKLRARGTQVFIATDNMDTFIRWTVPAMRLEQLFDGILDSYRIKALKEDFEPDGTSRFFQSYLVAHSIRAEECLLIDDSPHMQPLRDYGINCHQIEPGQLLPALMQYLPK